MDATAANRQRWNDECGRGWPLTRGLARTGLILLLVMPAGPALGDNTAAEADEIDPIFADRFRE